MLCISKLYCAQNKISDSFDRIKKVRREIRAFEIMTIISNNNIFNFHLPNNKIIQLKHYASNFSVLSINLLLHFTTIFSRKYTLCSNILTIANSKHISSFYQRFPSFCCS